jgi:hypothetical protein
MFLNGLGILAVAAAAAAIEWKEWQQPKEQGFFFQSFSRKERE